MKLDGFLRGSGKIGSIVTARVGSATIAREYNPNVSNPNTQAQVDQRAKMKLMSQVAAALAPVIAIPKEGLKSSRNLFIKKNFDLASATSGVAQLTYENIQLTNGNAGIPAIEATRTVESGIMVNLAERCDASVSRIVYIVYQKTSENTLQYMESTITSAPGSEGKFPASLLYVAGDIVIFAYGMKDLNSKARAKYSNYNVTEGTDIASLVLSRQLSYSDYQFTETRGATIFAGENSTVVVPEGSIRVFVTAAGPGSVSGAGVYEIGQNVTVVATPSANADFIGWYINGTETRVSANANYTFEAATQVDLVARFESQGSVVRFTVETEKDVESEDCSVSPDSQSVIEGESATVTAVAGGNYSFGGWYNGNTQVSTSATYTFIPTEDVNLRGHFFDNSGGGGDD